MKLFYFIKFICLCVFCEIDAVTVNVPDLGHISGTETYSSWTNRTIHAFYGIRFGLAPSGTRRYKPPEPVERWEGTYDATYIGRECPQLERQKNYGIKTDTEDPEDCLFLNVFTPEIPDNSKNQSKLPVMVYIPGGGFYLGKTDFFPPNYLLEKDIVLVVLQYRLGPLGFLSLHTDDIAGNVAFMDMVLGLKWVNKNIGSFGGDNTRITAFGQSAGAGAIALLQLSPMGKGLFQNAILQSGCALNTWITLEDPIYYARNLFKVMTKKDPDSIDEMRNYFMNANVDAMYDAAAVLFARNRLSQAYGVVVQKAGHVKFLEKLPKDIVNDGDYNGVPMIVGITMHDGSYFMNMVYDKLEMRNLLNDSDYLRNNLTHEILSMSRIEDVSYVFTNILNNKFFHGIFKSQEKVSFGELSKGLIDIIGMLVFKSPALNTARLNSKYHPTYLYTFDYRGQHSRFGYGKDTSKYPYEGGVHHSNDLLYLFPAHYPLPLNKEDTNMAKIMVDLWTSFAIHNKPQSSSVPEWSPLKRDSVGPYFHINSTSSYTDDNFIRNEFVAGSKE